MNLLDEDFIDEENSSLNEREKIKKMYHLKVRFDYASHKEVYNKRLLQLMLHPRHSRIYFLTFPLFWQALFSQSMREILEEASLVLVQSKLLIWGIKKIFKIEVPFFSQSDFYDFLIHTKDRYSVSYYVWGGEAREVRTVLKYLESFDKTNESTLSGHMATSLKDESILDGVFTSLSKLHPYFLLIGKGFSFDFPFKEKKNISANLILYSPSFFQSLSSPFPFKRKFSFSKFFFESIWEFLKNPFIIFKWLRSLAYILIIYFKSFFS